MDDEELDQMDESQKVSSTLENWDSINFYNI